MLPLLSMDNHKWPHNDIRWLMSAPSVLVGTHYQIPKICMCPVYWNGKTFQVQTFPQVSGTRDHWKPVLIKKTMTKKVLNISAFSMFFVAMHSAPLSNKLTFFGLPFAADLSTEVFYWSSWPLPDAEKSEFCCIRYISSKSKDYPELQNLPNRIRNLC